MTCITSHRAALLFPDPCYKRSVTTFNIPRFGEWLMSFVGVSRCQTRYRGGDGHTHRRT
jgi:hypothetical protein